MIQPLLISGPSGIGKSFLAKHLSRNYRCSRIVPTTTRKPRRGEVDGVDYYFVDEDEYNQRVADGLMFMSNAMLAAKYGFERRAVDHILEQDRTPISEIYTPKLPQFLAAYPDSQAIYLLPENDQLLRQRMALRGDTEEQIAYRLQEGRAELQLYRDGMSSLYQAEYVVTAENFRSIEQNLVSRLALETEGSIHKEREY